MHGGVLFALLRLRKRFVGHAVGFQVQEVHKQCFKLLSSWINRLAHANHCAEDEFCRYIGLGPGGCPETRAELSGVNIANLCNIIRLARSDLAAKLLVEHRNFPIRCIARENFQQCPQCVARTPSVYLRHWRFAWSLTCETCGTALAPNCAKEIRPQEISAKLKVRGGRGRCS